jgi:hypothetical protein
LLFCRYTVRDIGFVDLVGADYALRLHAPAERHLAASEVLAAFDPEAISNIRFEYVPSEGPVRWSLARSARQEITLESAPAPEATSDLGADTTLNDILDGPVLSRISQEALDTFAFVIRIDSTSTARNGRVQRIANSAIRRLEEVASQLPRPITQPLQQIVVSSEDRSRSPILLWSLGLADLAQDENALALVYGRGKLAGPVLQADAIEERELIEQLVLIGESCECDTSRAWNEEPRLPLRWDDEQRAAAIGPLGFDPDSPMVMGEVARILTRGPKQVSERPDDPIESLLFGYQETDLVADSLAPARGGATNATTTSSAAAERDILVVEAGEGDWGFEDESTSPPDEQRAYEPESAAPAEPHAESPSALVASWRSGIVIGLVAFLLLVCVAVALLVRGGERR